MDKLQDQVQLTSARNRQKDEEHKLEELHWQTRTSEAEAELARVRVQLAGIQSGADSSLAEVMAMARDEAERHAQTKAAKAVLERTLAELSDQLQEQAQAADDEKRLLRQVQLLLLRCPKLLLLANQVF